MYRPRHNGVIVTSGRGVVRGMAVRGGGVVRDHNAGGNVNEGGGEREGALIARRWDEPRPSPILLNYINPL